VPPWEHVCNLALTAANYEEHIMASRMADNIDDVEVEDILGLMFLIALEVYRR